MEGESVATIMEGESSCYEVEMILDKIRIENEKIEKHIARRNKLTAKLKQRKLKPKKGRYLGFILNDLRNEKKKTEELVVSKLLRSNLPTNDRKRKDTLENLKRSMERVEELRLEYQNLAFPKRGVAEEGEEAQLRENC